MGQLQIKQIVKENNSVAGRKDFISQEARESIKTAGEVVLSILFAAGTLALAVMAPNAIQLLKYLPGIKRKKTYDSETEFVRMVYYLKSRGYIKLQQDGSDFKVKITQKGRKKVIKLNLQNLKIPKSKHWDGKWWLAIADVPVEEKYQADKLRKKLKRLGFYPLQKTVWVFPYDPRDQVDFVSAYYKLDRYLTMLRVDHIDPIDEQDLIKFFKAGKIL